jgi:hypothetical protein
MNGYDCLNGLILGGIRMCYATPGRGYFLAAAPICACT